MPYPKSWLWSKDEAALYLQRYVRGWLVRKRPDVQEMRQFWKVNVRNTMCIVLDRFFISTIPYKILYHIIPYYTIQHHITSYYITLLHSILYYNFIKWFIGMIHNIRILLPEIDLECKRAALFSSVKCVC